MYKANIPPCIKTSHLQSQIKMKSLKLTKHANDLNVDVNAELKKYTL